MSDVQTDQPPPAPAPKWAVEYQIPSFGPEVRHSPPYDTQAIAQSHRDDIASFEGVAYAIVVPVKP